MGLQYDTHISFKGISLEGPHSPKANPPIAAARTAAMTPVALTLTPFAEPSNTDVTSEPDPLTLPLPSPDVAEVEVGVGSAVDRVTGSDELFKEVAEYGAENE
jgi:hypothetical protein